MIATANSKSRITFSIAAFFAVFDLAKQPDKCHITKKTIIFPVKKFILTGAVLFIYKKYIPGLK